jgi:hypothetical protein
MGLFKDDDWDWLTEENPCYVCAQPTTDQYSVPNGTVWACEDHDPRRGMTW